MAAAVALPGGLAVAWIPLRTLLPNVDLALALVAAVMVVGASRRRTLVTLAALIAAGSFAFFDTRPFDRWAVSRQPDIETTIALVVVGFAAGELAIRVARQRLSGRAGSGDLCRVMDTAALLATGEEVAIIIAAVVDDLTALLGLEGCWFDAEPSPWEGAWLQRDGSMKQAEHPRRRPRRADGTVQVALPVWGMGQVLGRFVLQTAPGVALDPDRVAVALTLADQVGAALAAQAPPPGPGPAPSGPSPRLRLVR